MGQADLEWLTANFPNLGYDPEAGVIEGELDVRAAYDSEQGKLHIGSDDTKTSMDSYLHDSFSIRIELDAPDHNAGPPCTKSAVGTHGSQPGRTSRSLIFISTRTELAAWDSSS